MKGINIAGVEVNRTRVDAPDRGGALSGLDVATLRRFLINVMKEGGVAIEDQASVMRCSRASLFRDFKPPGPDP